MRGSVARPAYLRGVPTLLTPSHTSGMGIETVGDLKHHLWRKLPPLRRHTVGKQVVHDITDVVVAEFPEDVLYACPAGTDHEGIVEQELLKTCKRHYCLVHGEDENNVGFIWTYIVAQLALMIIQQIIQWWRENKKNQFLMAGWKKGT